MERLKVEGKVASVSGTIIIVSVIIVIIIAVSSSSREFQV
jgi:hypothetical protein